jgi:O-succinylbenzoate synthase
LRIDSVILRQLSIPLKAFFETSFGRQYDRCPIIVEMRSGDLVGYGEVVTMAGPWYSEETTGSAWVILQENLVPLILGKEFASPKEFIGALAHLRRNNMAKTALEEAFWDLYAKSLGQPLSQALGGDPSVRTIPVGVSIGIQDSISDLVRIVGGFVEKGYKRMKIKIKPGWDYAVIKALRTEFGNIPMMADANSAYSLNDIDLFRRMDEFGLMMIEQPLAHDDIFDHAKLQSQIQTPICLDESIHTPEDARKALEMGACRIINVKVGRVGGLTAVQEINAIALKHAIPLWCGGMLETGIGRAINVHLTTLSGFTLPGDTSATDRYFDRDITDHFVLNGDGTLTVPTAPGIGVTVHQEVLEGYTVRQQRFEQ